MKKILALLLIPALAFGQTTKNVTVTTSDGKTGTLTSPTQTLTLGSAQSFVIPSGASIINNGMATGFSTGSAVWGDITGTLSSQTDLQTALNGKQATITFGANVQTAIGLTLNGSGALVGTTSPAFVTPSLGAATATSINGAAITSTGSANQYLSGLGTYSLPAYSGFSTNATSAVYANTSGYSTNSGFSTNSAASTYATTSGYSTNSGFSTNAALATYANTTAYSTNSGFATNASSAAIVTSGGSGTFTGTYTGPLTMPNGQPLLDSSSHLYSYLPAGSLFASTGVNDPITGLQIDGTSLSYTTGTLSINTAHSNTWSALQTFNLFSGTGTLSGAVTSPQPTDIPLTTGDGLLTSFINSTLGPAQGNISACGDSLTAGDGVGGTFPAWPYVLQNLPFARNMTIRNFGASGQITAYGVTNYSTTTGVGIWQNNYLNVSQSTNPHAVSLLTGPNFLLDFWGYNDLQQIAGWLNPKTTTATLNGTTAISALGTATNLTVGCYIVSTATNTITTDGTNVSNGDTVTLGSTVYRFETTPVQINDITIGSNAANSLAALSNAISGSAGRLPLGTYFFPGTNPNPVAFGSNVTSTILTVSSRAQGSSANSIACSTTAAHLTVAHATLIGSHFPENTTVVSVNTGASTAVLSNAAIDSVSGVTLTCGIETLSGWETSEQSFLALAQADSYHGHVVRMEIGPTSNNTVLYQTLLSQMNSFIDSNVNGTNGSDFVMKVNGLPGLNPPTPYNEADNIHWNATGNYAIGNFVDWQLRLDFTSLLTGLQNFFGPQSVPDTYLPTTVPKLKQSNLFQPYLYPGLVSTTASWTASSSTVVVTGSTTNIQTGMSVRSWTQNGLSVQMDNFSQGTVITAINSNTLTLSGNSNSTGTGTFYAQQGGQPLANVQNGDWYIGPGLNVSTGVNSNWIHFTSQFGANSGLTTDSAGWGLSLAGSTGGTSSFGSSSQNISFNGSGNVGINASNGTGTLALNGNETLSGGLTVGSFATSSGRIDIGKSDSSSILVEGQTGNFPGQILLKNASNSTVGGMVYPDSAAPNWGSANGSLTTYLNGVNEYWVNGSKTTLMTLNQSTGALVISGALTVTGTTTLATGLTGIAKLTAGVVGIANAATTVSGNNGTPTVAYGTGANSPTGTSIAGNGETGTITFTTGATPATAGTVLTATYASSFAYPTGSTCIIYPGNASAALLSGTSMLYSTGSTTTFVLTSGSVALSGLTTYSLIYQVKGY